MPIILVTAKTDTKDVVAGLEAGADEYLTKPIDQAALVARVQLGAADEGAARQGDRAGGRAGRAGTARSRQRVAAAACARSSATDRLKRFLSPQVADWCCRPATSARSKAIAARSRSCSATCAASPPSAESAEPEEVMARAARISRQPRRDHPRIRGHARALHRRRRDGVLQRSGADPDPCGQAVRMAVAMRAALRRA